ncbi:MAG: site-2 protease family protein [Bacillota bacterium]
MNSLVRTEVAFYLGGSRVSIHYSTLLLLVWAVASGRWPEMAILGAVLITHEMAHYIAMRGYGLTLTGIQIFPFGARMQISGTSGRPDVEVPVALAGPLNNFMLLGLGLLLGSVGWGGGYLWDFFLAANLALALFNLIPALPLDGGRLLRSYLSEGVGVARASRIMADWGMCWGVLLVAVAAYLGMTFDTYLWAFCAVGVILFMTALGEKRDAPAVPLGNLYRRRPRRRGRVPPPIEHLSAYGEETVVSVSRRLGSYGYAVIWVLDRNLRIMGKVTEEDLRGAVSSGRADEPLKNLLE